MQVRVLYFGVLKDLAGRSSEVLELPERATIADLLAHYRAAVPAMERYLPALAASINQEFATSSAILHENDEVALLPPVSGGAPRCELTREPIDANAIVATIKQPADGAVVVFDGIVRDNSRGRATLYLDYDAYEPMALKQFEALASQVLEKFPIRDIAIVHRLGRLEVGETSVLIAVASAHRAAAFEACRWLIDTLKRTVPIWKKEHFADGSVWADGEPFPPEITAASK